MNANRRVESKRAVIYTSHGTEPYTDECVEIDGVTSSQKPAWLTEYRIIIGCADTPRECYRESIGRRYQLQVVLQDRYSQTVLYIVG